MIKGSEAFRALVTEIGTPLGVTLDQVRSGSRKHVVSAVRMLVMKECRDRHGLSVRRISLLIEKDRTTVRNAMSKSKVDLQSAVDNESAKIRAARREYVRKLHKLRGLRLPAPSPAAATKC